MGRKNVLQWVISIFALSAEGFMLPETHKQKIIPVYKRHQSVSPSKTIVSGIVEVLRSEIYLIIKN